MKTFRFLDFKVYQDAKKFYKEILKVTKNFPKEFLFDLTSQLRRSVLSVILNIAEGSAKKSDKDFNRFVENALGSVNEVVACLEVACENGLIAEATFAELFKEAEEIAKQLGGLSKKLKTTFVNCQLSTVNC